MPEINGAKTQWNKQNIIRLALIAGIKYPNWGRKLLNMNSTISYCSKGCSPSVKVTICLGDFWSTRFCSSRFKLSHRFSWWEHALNVFPLGQDELVTIELSIHYAAINPAREWKILKVNGWIESLFENWRLGLNSSHIIWGRPIINTQTVNQKLYGRDFLN